MPMSVCGWASSLRWGRGRLCFKRWNWLTGAFSCEVLVVFVQCGIKTLLAGNTRGTVTYTKHHHTQYHPLFILTACLFSQCIYWGSTHWCTHLSLTYHSYQQATTSPQCKITDEEGDHVTYCTLNGYSEQMLIVMYLQINNNILHNDFAV